ncbi:MAG: flagellar hook-basal body complex protein [Desulfobulbaceae bacterium]|nr:MAG: flagellar hook-basal body complex protein [Desulfobulbaceae bacterium]
MASHNVMFNGISGINSLTDKMKVLGSNINNVNTIAHKVSRATFQNVLTSSLTRLGEAGNGVEIASITKNFQSGQLKPSAKDTDMAISGRGFFMVSDPRAAETLYTRDGRFRMEKKDHTPADSLHLVTLSGRHVQGVNSGSVRQPTGEVDDILIRRESLPQATERITLAVNLQSNMTVAASPDPLFSAWNGAASPPLAPTEYDFDTRLQVFDDQGQTIDLKIYFDRAATRNEWEFLITHDPALDRRMVTADTRYNDGVVAETGAGALLYGKLIFHDNGELRDIQAWQVPPDGNLIPNAGNMLPRDPQSGLHSFNFNLSGIGPDLTATVDFGVALSARAAISLGGAKADGSGDAGPNADVLSSWRQVYDRNGNQVRPGDQISFSGFNGAGAPVNLTYVVDFAKRVEDLLVQLENAFNSRVYIKNGHLEFHELQPGPSRLTISSVSYRDAAASTPEDNPRLAQIFGAEGTAFRVVPGDDFGLAPIRTTSYATASTTLFQNQDGFGAGFLQNISLRPNGVIVGHYSNSQILDQAQIRLADFVNYRGLMLANHGAYRATEEAGQPMIGVAGSGSFGKVLGNSMEASNVDLARQFVDLIMTQRFFQANAKSISTSDELFRTLLRLV